MTCALPPPGWNCSRTPGHDGPCAARTAVATTQRSAAMCYLASLTSAPEHAWPKPRISLALLLLNAWNAAESGDDFGYWHARGLAEEINHRRTRGRIESVW